MGEAVEEAVGEEESVAEGDALRSVVVSSVSLRWAEVLSRSSAVCSVGAGGSSGPSTEANPNPAPAETTVAARAHAGASTTTAITRSHLRIFPWRMSHRSTANAPRIKVTATNSATSTTTVMLSIITQNHTIQGCFLPLSQYSTRVPIDRKRSCRYYTATREPPALVILPSERPEPRG